MKTHRAVVILAMTLLVAAVAHAASRPLSTREVAHRFLERMFLKNDVRGAYDAYAAPNFIQHNPLIADGLAGHHAYFEHLATQPQGRTSDWAHVFDMILVDGDKFAVLHHVFRSPEDRGRLFVDIWRVKDGKIAEHWDIIQDIPATILHSNGMGCGPAKDYASARAVGDTFRHPACGAPDPHTTKAKSMAIIDKYLAEIRSGDIAGGIRHWFSPSYRQHSPTIEDGADGAIRYLDREWGSKSKELPKLGPARVIGEGDYVLYHRLVTYPGAAAASSNVDIYRVTDGKISEHWDIKQLTPPTSANNNGMW